jgi:RES domain-containing protein
MIAYRISNPLYRDDLSGTGAKLYGGRWNSVGVPLLYLASTISLAWLEMLVHLQYGDKSTDFALLQIELPDTAHPLQLNNLKENWQQDLDYTQFIGDEFVRAKQRLLLKVPSAVVPEEQNWLVSPLHPDFKKTTIVSTKIFRFDERLFISP